MNVRQLSSLLVFFALFSGAAVGASDQCSSIIAHGLRNIAIDQSEDALIAAKYSRNCGSDFESRSNEQLAEAEVEVFGYGSGGGNFSRTETSEKLKTWCNQNKATVDRFSGSNSESQTFYQGAIDAWRRCIELNSDTLKFIPTITGDRKTVDIGIVWNGNTASGISFYGLISEGFECTAKEPNGLVEFPYEIRNQYVSINCRRNDSTTVKVNGVTYNLLPRGTITIQTAGKPFQLFFTEEYNPPAPLKEIQRLEAELGKKEIPVGTIITSVLTPDQFSSPNNPQYDGGVWVQANGQKLRPNTKYQKLTGKDIAPDMSAVKNALYVQNIVSGDGANNSNISAFTTGDPYLNWNWFISGRDIQGKRANNDWEQAVDQFQSYLTDDGTIKAQGRTHNFKHGRWGSWSNGSANIYGIGTKKLNLFYYVKID